MDRELEEERELAVVQAFLLACTALANALSHPVFRRAALATGQRFVVATLHGDGEGPAMPVRDAVRFLIRDVDGVRTKRLIDRDAAAAMVEVLVQEITESASEEPIPPDLLESALHELSEGLVEQQSRLETDLLRCLNAGARSTDQDLSHAFVTWMQFAPVFPPRVGSLHSDVAYTLFTGMRSCAKRRWSKVGSCFPVESSQLFSRESMRFERMANRFETLVGSESERVKELRSVVGGMRSLQMAMRRHGEDQSPADD